MHFQQRYLIAKLILIVILSISWKEFNGQQKYSIDKGKLRKSGRVGIAYHVQNRKLKKKENAKQKIFRKQKRMVQKGKRKHTKKLQAKETRKQMKVLLRSSKRINKHKPLYYWHERISEETSSGTKIFIIRSKFFIKNTFTNIKSIFVNKRRFDKKKKKNFKIENN